MSTDPDTFDTRTESDASSESEPCADRPSIELDSVVVNYEDSPDQRTMYPKEASGVDRMSTWLTADDAEFVALESFR
jgi:hypothetical protein